MSLPKPDSKRLLDTFLELVALESPSKREDQVVLYVQSVARNLGLPCEVDQTDRAIGGRAGNLLVRLPATDPRLPSLFFCAHMDTVSGNEPRAEPVVEGGVIRTSNQAVLGADDKAGVAVMLEAARVFRASDLAHGELCLLFTVAEEVGLLGAQHVEWQLPQHGYVLDSSSPPGSCVVSSPSHVQYGISVRGKAAHAGVAPKRGVNAIVVASKAIANLRHGLLPDGSTHNVGRIQGGGALNVVPEHVLLEGEIRSQDESVLDEVLEEVETSFREAAQKAGATVNMTRRMGFRGYSLPEDSGVVRLALDAAQAVGLQPNAVSTRGGSDANVLTAKGYCCAVLGLGMQDEHGPDEYIRVDDLQKAAEHVLAIIVLSGQNPGYLS